MSDSYVVSRFYTQFQKYKKVLNFYLLKESIELGDKSRNILATKTAINFIWPYSRIRPAKLTNHSARTERNNRAL